MRLGGEDLWSEPSWVGNVANRSRDTAERLGEKLLGQTKVGDLADSDRSRVEGGDLRGVRVKIGKGCTGP